jgi:tetratricopeptide (TPR) repeat protein
MALYLQTTNWLTVMLDQHNYYKVRGDRNNALCVATAVAQEFSHFPDANTLAGESAIASGKLNLASFYFNRALKLSESAKLAFVLFQLSIQTGKFDQALTFLSQSHRLTPLHNYRQVLQAAETIQKATQIGYEHIDRNTLEEAFAVIGLSAENPSRDKKD